MPAVEQHNARRTVGVLLAFLVGVALLAGAAALLVRRQAPKGPDAAVAAPGAAGGAPALQTAPQPDGAAQRAADARALAQLGPAPGQPGYAHIPIERAMALLADTGLRAPADTGKVLP